jgi:hypothetical protein
MKELNYLSACRSGSSHLRAARLLKQGSATTVLETLLLLLRMAGPPRRAERVRR